MTNRKQTIASLAIVGMALFTTVMTTMMSLPIQALALGHWNLDEDFAPSGFAEDGTDSSGTTDKTNDNGDDSTTAAAMDEDEEGGSEEDTGSNDKKDSDVRIDTLAYRSFSIR